MDGLAKFQGVDCRLIAPVYSGAIDFEKSTNFLVRVTGGLRTREEQRKLVAAGKSKTMHSYHLLGRAVDLCMFDKFTGELSWELPDFALLDKFIQAEADRFGVHISWGGHWVTLRDGPHWQLEAL